MVEAEAEMLGADSALAGVIRTWRVKYMGSDDCRVPMEQLIGDVVELMVPVSPTVDHDIIDPGLARAAGSAWRYGTVDEGDLDDALRMWIIQDDWHDAVVEARERIE
jgi:hypothetical protein